MNVPWHQCHAGRSPEKAGDLFVFALEPGFSALSLFTALETLQALNVAASVSVARWQLCSADGGHVRSSLGLSLPVDTIFDLPPAGATIVVVGGEDCAEAPRRLILWLQRSARRGVRIAGLHCATRTLAWAGLLSGRRATIHWRYQDGLIESFPEIDVRQSTYTIDDGIYTTAGGTAAMELFLALAERDHGEALASRAAEEINYGPIRLLQEGGGIGVAQRRRIQHPKLHQAILLMEEALENPVPPGDIARDLEISARQLERIFRKYLKTSPKRYYMELRLLRAHRLLVQSRLSVIEIAIACGFATPSHFSKCFRAKFQVSPHRLRNLC